MAIPEGFQCSPNSTHVTVIRCDANGNPTETVVPVEELTQPQIGVARILSGDLIGGKSEAEVIGEIVQTCIRSRVDESSTAAIVEFTVKSLLKLRKCGGCPEAK